MKALFALATAIAALTFAGSSLGDTFITDTLAPGGESAPAQGYRFTTDTLAPGGGPAAEVVVSNPGSFSWSDAGVGAGAATGLILATIGFAVIVGGRRNRLAT